MFILWKFLVLLRRTSRTASYATDLKGTNIGVSEQFPQEIVFHSLSNNEFEILNSTNKLSQSDMDRLSQMKFNPFQLNQNIALSANNLNLDTSFNTNSIKGLFI